MITIAAIAVIVSAVLIAALCITDPKRLRTAGSKAPGMAPARRRLLVAAACVPGLACAALGDAAAFLVWLGGCALFGWALATYYRSETPARHSR